MTRRFNVEIKEASLIFGLGRANSSFRAKVKSPDTGSYCVRTPSPFETQIRSCSSPAMQEEGPHVKARSEFYPRSNIKRFPVPDDKVPWKVPFPEYQPVYYTSKSVLDEPPWADKENILNGKAPEWNKMDGVINRVSHMGKYDIDPDTKLPRNPKGRTGISGRGCLGRWGPNHAADPIVTRWKVDDDGNVLVDKEGKKIAQFIAIQRKDSKEWAIPGGMVDAEEDITDTMKREFGEEALNSLEASESGKQKIAESVAYTLNNGKEVYKGYVDDPRNTDNAWMETVAMNFHDDDGSGVSNFKLTAGDDAMGVQWLDLQHTISLYASHNDFLRRTAEKLNASW